jgi:hypothetical protein
MTSRRLPENRAALRSGDITNRVVTGASASVFEEIARVAAAICQVPIAAVTLPATDSRWRHAVAGSSVEQWTVAETAFGLLMPLGHHGAEVIDVANASHSRVYGSPLATPHATSNTRHASPDARAKIDRQLKRSTCQHDAECAQRALGLLQPGKPAERVGTRPGPAVSVRKNAEAPSVTATTGPTGIIRRIAQIEGEVQESESKQRA